MFNTDTDSYSAYPLLPVGAYQRLTTNELDLLSPLVDARIYVLLDNFELGALTCIEAYITNITNITKPGSAVVYVFWRENGSTLKYQKIQPKVFEGGQSYQPEDGASSFILVQFGGAEYNGATETDIENIIKADKEGLEPPSCALLRLHPDCIVLAQKPPKLDVWNRPTVFPNDGVDGKPQAGARYRQQRNCVELDTGNNARVDYDTDSGTITITGGEGLGKGKFKDLPYSDPGHPTTQIPDYKPHTAVGLRSINGITDDVNIEGLGTVSVLSANEDGKGNNIFLTIEATTSNDKQTERDTP